MSYFLPIRWAKNFKVSVRMYKNWFFHAELMEVYFALLWRANALKPKVIYSRTYFSFSTLEKCTYAQGDMPQ